LPDNNTFNTKLEISGVQAYREAAKNIANYLKLITSEMALATAEFGKNDQSVEGLTAKQNILSKQFEQQADKVEAAKQMLALMKKDGVDPNSAAYQNMQRELNYAEAALKKTQKEIDNTTASLATAKKGNDDFAAVVGKIDNSLDTLGASLKMVTAQYANDGNSAKSAADKKAILNQILTEQESKVKTLESAYKKAVKEQGGMSDESQRLNKALIEAKTGVYETRNEIDDLSKSTDEAGKKTSVFGDVLKANLAAEVIKTSITFIIGGIKQITGAVKDYVSEGQAMATAAQQSHTLLTQVMRNTMDATDDEIQSMIKLAEAQARSGVVSQTAQTTALAELASFVAKKEAMEDMLPVMNDYIAYQYGTTASEEQARNVATALGKAIQGNIDGLAKQGFTLTDAQKKWFKTAEEAERVAFVMDMVGESMGGVNEALAQTDAGKMARVNTIMQQTQQLVGSMANAFKAKIMGEMLPSVEGLSNAFVKLLSGDGSIDEVQIALVTTANSIVDILTGELIEKAPALIEAAVEILQTLVRGVVSNLPTLLNTAFLVLNTLVNGIFDMLPILLEAAIDIVIGLADGIAKALPELIPTIVEMVIYLVQIIADNIPMLIDAALAIILGLVDGIVNALPILVAMAPDILIAIITGIIDALPKILDAAVDIMDALINGLMDAMPALIAATPELIVAMVQAIIKALPKIVDSAQKLIESFIGGLKKYFGETYPQTIEMFMSSLKDAIASFKEWWSDAGANIVKGVWEGIKNMGAWLETQVKDFFGGIVDGVKSVLGISSPSKVFAGIGGNMASGLGEGFRNSMRAVERDIQNAVPTRLNISADVDYSDGRLPRGTGNSGSFNITQNIYTPQYNYAEQQRAAARELRLIGLAV